MCPFHHFFFISSEQFITSQSPCAFVLKLFKTITIAIFPIYFKNGPIRGLQAKPLKDSMDRLRRGSWWLTPPSYAASVRLESVYSQHSQQKGVNRSSIGAPYSIQNGVLPDCRVERVGYWQGSENQRKRSERWHILKLPCHILLTYCRSCNT